MHLDFCFCKQRVDESFVRLCLRVCHRVLQGFTGSCTVLYGVCWSAGFKRVF